MMKLVHIYILLVFQLNIKDKIDRLKISKLNKDNYILSKEDKDSFIGFIEQVDNTSKEYSPISNADIKGKSLVILTPIYMILYFAIVFTCLIYLIINILLGVKEMNKDSKITS